MTDYADLEIGLHRYDPEMYTVEFRSSQTRSDSDNRSLARVQFNFQRLLGLEAGSAEYGAALSEDLFADPAAQTAYAEALANAQSSELPLHVRLLIGPSAPELHALYWESLRDPRDLVYSERMRTGLTRYLSSRDWRPVRPPEGKLQALVAIANPKNLQKETGLDPIDKDGELERARESLGACPISVLPEEASGCRATLKNLIDRQRDGPSISSIWSATAR
jgi:hypothetical protein